MSEAPPRRWWLRRPVIAVALLLSLIPMALVAGRVLGFWKFYYLPAESMEPGLKKGDRFVASMRGPGDLRRGDIIILETQKAEYVKRVAALPGDTIELVGGQVFLNDRPVVQRLVGTERVEGPPGREEARRLTERFPGEERPHHIYDMSYGVGDDFPRTVVRPGHVFVLGDNRDVSADSRFTIEVFGVEQVPIERIRGKPMFHGFFSSKRIGAPIGP